MVSLLTALSTLVLAAPAPVREPGAPKGPPPRVMTTTTAPDGPQGIETVVIEVVMVNKIVPQVDGKEVVVTEKVPVHKTKVLTLDDKGVQVYGSDGKLIDPREVRHRLKRPTAVLVSADGEPVDPFFLRLAREDTLIVVSKKLLPVPTEKDQ
jgi:hypothetical protein